MEMPATRELKDERTSRSSWHMPESNGELSPETAAIFNSSIAAAVISAMFEIGFFDSLKSKAALDLETFCRDHDISRLAMSSMIDVLQRNRIVEVSEDGTTVSKGPVFEAAFKDKGYFLWLIKGYGQMLQKLGSLVRKGAGSVNSVGRDGESIAFAGRDYGGQFVDSHFNSILHERPFKTAADLGCGSAARLIRLAQRDPEFRGVGVDINEGAVRLASEAIRDAGLENRVTMLQGNVSELQARPEFADVEVLFCFFMGHDLWPRENAARALCSIRQAFPKAKRFLLSDTYKENVAPDQNVPIFTLGFEVTHAVMGQVIPTVQDWMDLFPETGWECVARKDIGIAYSTIFDLR